MSECPHSRYPPPFVVRCIDATNWPDDLPEALRLIEGGLYVAERMAKDKGGNLGFVLHYPSSLYRIARFTVQPDSLPPFWLPLLPDDTQ